MQLFCQLVSLLSVARVSWKTIKQLRRDEAELEFEILQGWTILALHHVAIQLKIETVISFFIPFYFHLKAIALVVLFLVPSFNAKVEGNAAYGLSPLVSYVFDYLIVPAVQKVHMMMDDNPKEFLKLQLAILPLVLLDLFVLPGIIIPCDDGNGNGFTSESESKSRHPSEEAFPFRGDKVVAGESPMQLEQNPTCSLTDDSTEIDDNVLVDLNDAPVTPPRRRASFFPRTSPKFNSPSAKSKLASSAMRLRRISRDYATQNGANTPERSVGHTQMKRRRNRQSLGDALREIVTGSSSIRVRDHLFDLDLPSTPRTPCRSPRAMPQTKQPDSDAHVTKRRRSRRQKKSSCSDN